MSDNGQKINFGGILNLSALYKALSQIHNIAKALPATAGGVKGSIVGAANYETSGAQSLPKVSVPHFGPEYIRYPTQPGDKGVILPVDVNVGNMSGQGPSGAPLLDNSNTNTGNLNPGIFVPIGNANWEAAPSANVLYHYGVKPASNAPQAQKDMPFGVGIFDQVFSKAKGSHIVSTDKDGNTTLNSSNTQDSNNPVSMILSAAQHVISVGKNTVASTTHGPGTIQHNAATSVNWTTPTSTHTGTINVAKNVNITQNLVALGTSSLTGGISSGALEVAADIDGGLVQATMGLAVTDGLTADTATISQYMSLVPMAISALPASPSAGMVAFVNNGIASPTYKQTVSTTGSTTQPVYSNGTNWYYL